MNRKSTYIRTGLPQFDNLYPMVKSFLGNDLLEMVIDGNKIRGYRSPDAKSIWIRDYSDIMRGMKYFEEDLKSVISHFAATQAANGRIFDYFTTFPEKLPSERENWTKYVRVPVEADVEFRFVKAAFLAWQATGDDEWMERLLSTLEKALNYVRSHPWRWDNERCLVKRPYTIDTWDFAYTAGKAPWLHFQIDDHTFWGVMHGDNSGYYEAFRIMARLRRYFGKNTDAEVWEERAETLKNAMNRVCWNGKFYTHFVKITPVEILGVDESAQLSLSNPMAVNRGAADLDKGASIVREYQKRRESVESFAEWFSIDPPFPDGIFGDEKLIAGAYVNGGIMPLVGGELAKAAFNCGFEAYGVDILKRYYEMIARSGETYLWYFPDGTPATIETSTSPEAQLTDGWGSSAMLYSLFEGLAGVEDRLKLFREVRLSPRWAAAEVSRAQVRMEYRSSGAYISYGYRYDGDTIGIEVETPASQVDFHILLPVGVTALSVTVDGKDTDFINCRIQESGYVDFTAAVRNRASVIVRLFEGM